MGRVRIHVSAGAASSELVGRHGDGWKVRVAAPPERGRANAALVDLLAGVLELPAARVAVVSGHTARRKMVEVEGLETPELLRRLEAALAR
jgi:uncharacterized protein (TIGR00251 family)